ncbi:HlyD family efflux transporter periplasmic adaptor subunit [Candidatus Poribacteria bacterium]|nr:HlyD family efflux transporter periplasmic adaptor subunit [Candidatus Poribacteria bacterium]
MGKWKVIAIICVVVLVVGAAVVVGRMVFATKSENKNANASAIQTATVERGDIAVTIDATGTIKPLNIVEISSKASGKILELNVDAGDYVEKDAIIAVIEKTYVQISLEQAEADLKAAQARYQQAEIDIQLQKEQSEIQIRQARESLAEAKKRLEQIKEQIRLEKIANKRGVLDAENGLKIANLRYKLLTSETVREENKKRAQASVTQEKVNLDLAEKEHARNTELFGKELISKASLESSEAQYNSAKARYESTQEQLKLVEQPASEVELELAQADIKKAEFSLEVAKEKIEAEATRDMDIELQQQRVVQAEDSLKLALTNQRQIDRKQRDLQSAEASLMRSQGQRDLRKIEFEDTVIRAPISGTVLEKRVEEGQVITSRLSSLASSEGQTLITMADLNSVYVVTEVDETDIGKVEIGQPVTITVEAYPDMPFEGQVLKIAPLGQVIQNITTFEVTSELKNVGTAGASQGLGRGQGRWQGGQRGDMTEEQRERFREMRQQREAEGQNPSEQRGSEPQESTVQETSEPPPVAVAETEDEDDWGNLFGGFLEETQPANTEDIPEPQPDLPNKPFLKPGMNASVQISAVNKTGILTLPTEAVLDMRGRKMVRLLGEDGQPGRPQPIVVGVSSYDRIEILSGLAEGDIVAIGAFQQGNERSEMFRRMMQNPASTVRRMGSTGGPRGGR